MPSRSYKDFLELLSDVEKLNETHYQISQGKVGRKKLGFLTRSATVMLSAAWERYNENILIECIDYILTTDIKAKDLPMPVKKYISTKVKTNKNEITPIELADDGWRRLWRVYAIDETEILHTPKSKNLKSLFKRYLGITDFTIFWFKDSSTKIDELISVRGDIAHKGSKATYVRINWLKKKIDLVT